MPDTATTSVIAAIAIVAFLGYVFAWRATRGRSLVARALVRGVVPLALLAIPVLLLTTMHAEAPRTMGKIDGQLYPQMSEDGGEMSSAARSERLPAESSQQQRQAEAEARLRALEEARAQEEQRAEEQAAGARESELKPGAGAPSEPPSEPGGEARGEAGLEDGAGDTFGEQPFAAPPLPGARPTAPRPGSAAEMNQPRIVLPPPVADGPDAVPPADSSIVAKDAEAPAAPAEPAPPQTLDGTRGGGVPFAAAPSAPSAAAQDAAWDVVPVFFGTDREEVKNASRLTFNAERGRRLQLGEAFVTIPKIHEVPQIERPWAIRLPYFDVTLYEEAEDPKKHFTMQSIMKLSKEEFLSLLRKRLDVSQRFKDHAVVFVHGYNTSFDHAVYRTAQIAYDLKFDGAAFLYSWPSGGAVASYTYDRESAGAAEPYLRQFLELVVKESGAKSISIIGHSMGSQPLLDVLKDMKDAAPAGVVISQVILAAPDVDADNFINLALRIEGLAKGVTLYAASNDRALIVSRNFWRNPRAGDVLATGPLIIPGMDTIDVTAVSTDTFALNHSGYAENNVLLQDIGKLIESGQRPPDQRLTNLKRVTTERGDYWRYTAP